MRMSDWSSGVCSSDLYVNGIRERHGEKRDHNLMDNNGVASPRFRDIIAEIRDLGFEAGATLKRPGERTASKRRVDFNQGVDARILCKTQMSLPDLATICLTPPDRQIGV